MNDAQRPKGSEQPNRGPDSERLLSPLTKPDKGKSGGSCNRQACQAPGATWFNKSTRAYYCENCARDINRLNRTDAMALYGTELCILPSPPLSAEER